MKNPISALLAMGILIAGQMGLSNPVAARDRCQVFVLAKEGNQLILKRETISEDEVIVFESSSETGIIDVILPPGPGGSGSMEQLGAPRRIAVSCRGGVIQVTIKVSGGKDYARPEQPVSALAEYDIRLSVIGGDGTRLQGVISGYESYREDTIAPLENPFAGAISPGPTDYIVFTKTTERVTRTDALHGHAPLDFVDGHHYVTTQLPDGSSGRMIVDCGAATTVITRATLPGDVEVRELKRLAYTPDGVKRLAGVLGGATGEITKILGYATLPILRIGTLELKEIDAIVLEDLPLIGDHTIVGILGMDVLGRAEVIALEYPGRTGREPMLSLNPESSGQEPAARIPFSLSGNIYLRGLMNGVPVCLILDSGARFSILDESAAQAIGLKRGQNTQNVRGLGGGAVPLQATTVETLRLAGHDFEGIELQVGALPVFKTIRGDQNAGLIGNSFLSKFERFEIDFPSQEVRLYE